MGAWEFPTLGAGKDGETEAQGDFSVPLPLVLAPCCCWICGVGPEAHLGGATPKTHQDHPMSPSALVLHGPAWGFPPCAFQEGNPRHSGVSPCPAPSPWVASSPTSPTGWEGHRNATGLVLLRSSQKIQPQVPSGVGMGDTGSAQTPEYVVRAAGCSHSAALQFPWGWG